MLDAYWTITEWQSGKRKLTSLQISPAGSWRRQTLHSGTILVPSINVMVLAVLAQYLHLHVFTFVVIIAACLGSLGYRCTDLVPL